MFSSSAGLEAVAELVVVAAVPETRRQRAEEEQLPTDDRTAERAADLVAVIGRLRVLDVADRSLVDGRQHETLHRSRAESASQVVVMRLPTEGVAARLGDRADDAAERAAELRRNADGLDLHFLQILEHRVLPRLPIQQAVGGHAVHRELVLRAARAVDLQTALDVALIHRRRGHRDRLEAAPLRNALELLGGDVVRDERAAHVDVRCGLAVDLQDLAQLADVQLRVDLERAPGLRR